MTLRRNCLTELTAKGSYVTDGLVQYRPDIKGSFDEEGDSYSAARHQIKVDVIPTIAFNKAFRDVVTEKVLDVADRTNPIPSTFIDHGSDTINEVLTPGSVGQITGRRLKVDIAAADEGVFFVAEDKTETKVPALVKNNPSELIFSIPALAPGFYDVVIRSRYRGGLTPRNGTFKEAIEVLAPAFS